jgi:hypothetical protein
MIGINQFRRTLLGWWLEFNRMISVASVSFRPTASWSFLKISIAVWALLTIDDPWCYVIGKVTGMSFVIKCELFDSSISSV